ncbi:zinc-dependent metalloprotease family protein [Peribacillus simplex]|uniref:zinc-dependent metalloprotease family protein n=1 Tax=Peribacillus TaxID=2675229 RepID=UPI0036728E5E
MKNVVKNTLLFSIILVFLIPASANAYTTFSGHKMSSGIGNYGKSTKFYYVDSSASGLTTKINNAFDRWIYSSKYAGILTPTSYRKTTVKSSSTIDIYQVTSFKEAGVYGKNYSYVNSTNINPQKQNWYWSKIEISKQMINNYPQYLQTTISHEIGHAFGLNHTSKQLMDAGVNKAYDLGIQYPRKDEYNGINYLY